MVFNNAVWTFGHLLRGLGPLKAEVCFSSSGSLHSHWVRIIGPTIGALLAEDESAPPEAVIQNIGITLGIVATTLPQLLLPHVPDIFVAWCKSLELLSCNSQDCWDAYSGLLNVLLPHIDELLLSNDHRIMAFVKACSHWTESPENESIAAALAHVLQTIKNGKGSRAWKMSVSRLGPGKESLLRDNFRLN